MNKRQEAIMTFIRGYKTQYAGRSPTIREIAEGCGISSTSVVTHHMNRLVQMGLVLEFGGSNKNRNIRLPGEVWYQNLGD